ncbi:hypothetical protein ACGFNU_06905 [Spirillospora sp. NPDC048911]|uniref:hypothetical protein n=1 Tax=Spirillospora sp. NPDC048911 TaxID=3364527 RepID=UPI00371CE82A
MTDPHPPVPPTPGKRLFGLPAPRVVIAGGLVVLLVVAAAVAYVVSSGDGGSAGETRGKGNVAVGWSQQAARQLRAAPGLQYDGTLSADGRPVQVRLRVTRAGSASGSLTVAGLRADLVSVGGRTFIKANAAFWRTYGGESSHPENFAGRWSKAPATLFRLDVADVLGAGSIADLLAKTTARPAEETIGGTAAYRLRTQRADYFVTAAAPHRLLRVHPAGPGDPRLSASGLAATGPLIAELRPRVAALGGAADPALRFRPGKLTFVNCEDNLSGCTVRVPASLTSPEGAVPAGARAALRTTITAGTRRLGSCTASGPVPDNREVVLRCTAGGRAWRAWLRQVRDTPGAHPYGATARVVGEAVASADVGDLLKKIDRER